MANRLLRDWTGSEAVDQLSEGAEVFFTRLIMKADDFGCYYGNPKILGSNLYPLKEIATKRIIKLRDECAAAGVIQVYTADGKEYVHIPNFGQRLRSMNRRFPEPPELTKIAVRSDDGGPLTDVSQMTAEGKGREEETEVEEEVEEKGKALPFDGELLKKWFEWEKHRKEKRNPLTPTAREKQIKLLGARPPNEAIAIIEYSLTNGYSGLFEQNKNGIRHNTSRTSSGIGSIIDAGKNYDE